MSFSDVITLIGKTNKISLIFFVITCVLLGYEFYLYLKDKKGNKKPSIPLFKKKQAKEPLSTHDPKPMPTPPPHPSAAPPHAKRSATPPPLIAQMSPPTMRHTPPIGKKKKKLSRGAKVTMGATVALMILTVGIAWRLNQPSQQQAINTTTTRADEFLTPGAGLIDESSQSATTDSDNSSTNASRNLIPTITPRTDVIDLTSLSPTQSPVFEQNSATDSSQTSDQTETTTYETADSSQTESTESSKLSQLPVTGGTEEATLAPTLPIAGTIQYSLGLLVVASSIVIASLIF